MATAAYGKVKVGRRWHLTRPILGGRRREQRSIATFDDEHEIDAVLALMCSNQQGEIK